MEQLNSFHGALLCPLWRNYDFGQRTLINVTDYAGRKKVRQVRRMSPGALDLINRVPWNSLSFSLLLDCWHERGAVSDLVGSAAVMSNPTLNHSTFMYPPLCMRWRHKDTRPCAVESRVTSEKICTPARASSRSSASLEKASLSYSFNNASKAVAHSVDFSGNLLYTTTECWWAVGNLGKTFKGIFKGTEVVKGSESA